MAVVYSRVETYAERVFATEIDVDFRGGVPTTGADPKLSRREMTEIPDVYKLSLPRYRSEMLQIRRRHSDLSQA